MDSETLLIAALLLVALIAFLGRPKNSVQIESRDAVREAALLAFRDAESHATLEAQSKASQGETVKVRVEHSVACHSFLLVTPDTRDVVDPYYELRGRLIDDIMAREGSLGVVPTKPRVVRHGRSHYHR